VPKKHKSTRPKPKSKSKKKQGPTSGPVSTDVAIPSSSSSSSAASSQFDQESSKYIRQRYELDKALKQLAQHQDPVGVGRDSTVIKFYNTSSIEEVSLLLTIVATSGYGDELAILLEMINQHVELKYIFKLLDFSFKAKYAKKDTKLLIPQVSVESEDSLPTPLQAIIASKASDLETASLLSSCRRGFEQSQGEQHLKLIQFCFLYGKIETAKVLFAENFTDDELKVLCSHAATSGKGKSSAIFMIKKIGRIIKESNFKFPYELFFQAITSDNTELVKLFLSKRMRPDWPSSYGVTPLQWACFMGANPDIILALMEETPEEHLQQTINWIEIQALGNHHAASGREFARYFMGANSKGGFKKHSDSDAAEILNGYDTGISSKGFVKFDPTSTAPIEVLNLFDYFGKELSLPALLITGKFRIDSFRVLLDKAPSTTSISCGSFSLLEVAATLGRVDAIPVLFSAYVSVNQPYFGGYVYRAIRTSVIQNDREMQRKLCNITILSDSYELDFTPLMLFSVGGNEEAVEMQLQLNIHHLNLQSKENSSSALHFAVYFQRIEIVRKILARNAVPDLIDNDGMTPLMIACRDGYADICRLLIAYGAILDVANPKNGMTALHYAARENKESCCHLLIKANSNLVNILNKKKVTPFALAILSQKESLVEYFRKQNVDPSCLLTKNNKVKIQFTKLIPEWLREQL